MDAHSLRDNRNDLVQGRKNDERPGKRKSTMMGEGELARTCMFERVRTKIVLISFLVVISDELGGFRYSDSVCSKTGRRGEIDG